MKRIMKQGDNVEELKKSVRFRAQLEFAVVAAINMIGGAITNAQEYLPAEVHEKLSVLSHALQEAHRALRKLNLSE